jgi:hypothetical protein
MEKKMETSIATALARELMQAPHGLDEAVLVMLVASQLQATEVSVHVTLQHLLRELADRFAREGTRISYQTKRRGTA